MATFDEVFSDAIQELEERGLLLNMHLLDLVGGDEKLMQSVRDALIQNGLAHDRYGVGLAKSSDFDTQQVIARIQPAPIDSTTDPSDEIVFAGVSEAECDWWLMSGGATSGPFSLETLIQMRQLGEVSDIDMIRDGRHGMWLIPRDVVELAGIAPARRPSAKTTSAFVERPSVQAKTTHEPVSSRSQPTLAKPGARQAPILSTSEIPSAVPSHANCKYTIDYFLWDSGLSIGPVTMKELQARIDSGSLAADDFVQVGRDGDWQPVSLAMGVPRPPLQIPQAALNALQQSSSELTAAISPQFAPARPNTPPIAIPIVGQSVPKPSKSVTTKSEERPESPLVRGWVKAGDLVGGQSRLWSITALAAIVIAVVVWLQQPRPAGVIYQDLLETHQRVSADYRYQPGASKAVRVSSDEIRRIKGIKDGLARRASAAQPAIQELLWACEYGLIPLMEQQYGSPDLDRVFLGHMSRAEGLLTPSNKTTELPRETRTNPHQQHL